MKLEESWGQSLHPQAWEVWWLVVALGVPHILEQLEGAIYEEGVHTWALLHEQVFDLWERDRVWKVLSGRVPMSGATVAEINASGDGAVTPEDPKSSAVPREDPLPCHTDVCAEEEDSSEEGDDLPGQAQVVSSAGVGVGRLWGEDRAELLPHPRGQNLSDPAARQSQPLGLWGLTGPSMGR